MKALPFPQLLNVTVGLISWIAVIFSVQILSAWHGLSDPKQFQSDVYDILDTPSVATLSSLLKNALAKYRTEKAQVFLRKYTTCNINFAMLTPVPLSQLGMFLIRGWSKEWQQ